MKQLNDLEMLGDKKKLVFDSYVFFCYFLHRFQDSVADHARRLEEENQRLREEIAELKAIVEQLRTEVAHRQQQERDANRGHRENTENCDPVVRPIVADVPSEVPNPPNEDTES